MDSLPHILSQHDGPRTALLVSHDLSLTGAPIALLGLARVLRRQGLSPIIASPVTGPLAEAAGQQGIPTHVVPGLLSETPHGLDRCRVGLVVANTLLSHKVVRAFNGTGVPVLWWVHEAEALYGETLTRLLPHWLCSNVSVVTPGDRARRSLLARRPHYEVNELLYGIEDVAHRHATATSSDRETSTSAPDKAFVIVGTLESRKGQDVLLEAIARLPEAAASRCRFLFVGSALNASILKDLEDAAQKRPGRVSYLGSLSREDCLRTIAEADCLICASRDDPMPVVVAEACMFSKPTICSEHAGTTSCLSAYKAGMVYHDNSPDELAACICRMLDMEGPQLDAMRGQARRLFEERFSESVFERNVAEVLERLHWRSAHHEVDESDLAQTLDELEGALDAARRELDSRTAQLEGAISRCKDLEHALDEDRARMESLADERDRMADEAQRVKKRLKALTSSNSWKMTRPLRKARGALKRLFNQS